MISSCKTEDMACEYFYVANITEGRYILRSVGQDKILWTEDDVFPDLLDQEKKSIGWVDKFENSFDYPELTCMPK